MKATDLLSHLNPLLSSPMHSMLGPFILFLEKLKTVGDSFIFWNLQPTLQLQASGSLIYVLNAKTNEQNK